MAWQNDEDSFEPGGQTLLLLASFRWRFDDLWCRSPFAAAAAPVPLPPPPPPRCSCASAMSDHAELLAAPYTLGWWSTETCATTAVTPSWWKEPSPDVTGW